MFFPEFSTHFLKSQQFNGISLKDFQKFIEQPKLKKSVGKYLTFEIYRKTLDLKNRENKRILKRAR